jgi:hypothetical protein
MWSTQASDGHPREKERDATATWVDVTNDYETVFDTGLTCFDLPEDRKPAAAAEFVLNELMKVTAYAELSEEDRVAIAVAVAHISGKFYLDGCNRDRRREGMAHRRWFKGCWVGSGWPDSCVASIRRNIP